MKYLKFSFIIIFFGGLLFLVPEKKKTIFEASDELHLIQLFEEENSFKLLHNGFNFAKGNYDIKGDSIVLSYSENEFIENENLGSVHANNVLTRLLLIEEEKIKSIDGKNFCAIITKNEIPN